jgi:S-adenosylmethionine hydrolase
MATITLTTDLGLKDYYVASVKGAILKEEPSTNIVDISHEIPAFDLQRSAFVIKNCYQDFPDGTIHIIGINSDYDVETPHIALFANGHYFIGAYRY